MFVYGVHVNLIDMADIHINLHVILLFLGEGAPACWLLSPSTSDVTGLVL